MSKAEFSLGLLAGVLIGFALAGTVWVSFNLELMSGRSLDPTMYPYPTVLWDDGSFHIALPTRSLTGCVPWGECDFGYRNRGIFRPEDQMDCVGMDCLKGDDA